MTSGTQAPTAVYAAGRVIVRESDGHRLHVVEVLGADDSVLGVSVVDIDAEGS